MKVTCFLRFGDVVSLIEDKSLPALLPSNFGDAN